MLLVAADRFTHSFISLVPCINIHSWVRIFLLDQFFTFLLLFFIQFISSLMLRRMVWVQKICPVFSRIEWKALPHHRAIPSSPLRQGKWIHNQLSAPFPCCFHPSVKFSFLKKASYLLINTIKSIQIIKIVILFVFIRLILCICHDYAFC